MISSGIDFFVEFCSLFPIQAVLKQHYSDNPKLAYTGEPIVKWPERVSRIKKVNDSTLGSKHCFTF